MTPCATTPFGPCADLPASFVVWWSLALWSIHGDAEIDKGASSIESCPISCNRISYKKTGSCVDTNALDRVESREKNHGLEIVLR